MNSTVSPQTEPQRESPPEDAIAPLLAPLNQLPGLGPKLAPLYAKLIEGERIIDLLFHLPVDYVARPRHASFAQAQEGEIATFEAFVDQITVPRAHNAPKRVLLRDESGFLQLIYFRVDPGFLERTFKIGSRIVVSGLVQSFQGARQIAHPDWVCDPAKDALPPLREPVYPLAAGVHPRTIQRLIGRALALVGDIDEWIDPLLLARQNWPRFANALRILHNPDLWDLPDPPDRSAAQTLIPEAALMVELPEPSATIPHSARVLARQRLAYDELFARQISLRQLRQARRASGLTAIKSAGGKVQEILRLLPYQPTRAQIRVVEEIRRDFSGDEPMLRLLQGDVGSGKTLVAALAAAHAAEAGFQSAIMAPTEILARQQASAIDTILKPANITTGILTGRDKGKARQALLTRLAAGEIEVLVGTQALFQADIAFNRLGFVVIDEQHRFGVQDRVRLVAKGQSAHLLVMSATPIPRSLALAAHGDMDLSILDEKPAGRKKIDTRAVSMERLPEIIESLGRAMAKGGQIYWICPLVEDNGEPDLSAAQSRYDGLRVRFPDVVGLVHGRLPAADKDAALTAFKSGRIKILVATTVIEVGVDAPDATLIVIERAEKFGLAQLHQLRGRVGRGDKEGVCLLLYQAPLSANARERMGVLRHTDDGFAIAEADFKLRGAGDILGERQSGSPGFRFVNLITDGALVALAHQDATLLLARDPACLEARSQASAGLLALFLGGQDLSQTLSSG